jgi:hypothetical protein
MTTSPPLPGLHQRARARTFAVAGHAPSFAAFSLPVTGTGASTFGLPSRPKQDVNGTLHPSKARFEIIAEGEKIFRLICNLEGRTNA